MLAAKAAGVRCAALTYGYNHGRPIAEEAPTLVIDNLRDLLPCADQAAEIVLPDDSLSPSRPARSSRGGQQTLDEGHQGPGALRWRA